MAAARTASVRCAIVVNVVLAIAATIAGCADQQDDTPGSLRVDGSAGGADGGTDGASISCSPLATGCLCIADDTEPGQIAECSPASIVQGASEQGVCCATESLCSCIRYTCRSDPASSFCQCGSVVALAGVTLGTPAAACPAPASGQKCCFSQDNASCICSRLACAAEETEVSGCSATAAGACSAGEDIAKCR